MADFETSYKVKTQYNKTIKMCSLFKFSIAPRDKKFSNHCFPEGAKPRPICNGAGPAGKGRMVSDTILGLKITEAANIHDWSYQFGTTLSDKKKADRVFHNNMIRLINAKPKQWWISKKLRLRIAHGYYIAVKAGGGASFWDKDLLDFTLKDIK